MKGITLIMANIRKLNNAVNIISNNLKKYDCKKVIVKNIYAKD